METGALQLARVIEEHIQTAVRNSGTSDDLFSKPPAAKSGQDENPDQKALRIVLRQLLQQSRFPTITEVKEILDQTASELGSRPFSEGGDSAECIEAVQVLAANVEIPEERIDRYRERFGHLTAITGLAHVFWGWSENPLDNLELRFASLRAASRPSHQIANIVFAAAGGAGRVPVRYFRSRIWKAAYEASWEFLLSFTKADEAASESQDIWQIDKGGLIPTENGPLVEIRVGGGRIPLGLQISDPLMIVETIAERLLSSSETASEAANAILQALDERSECLPRDLEKLVRKRVEIRQDNDSRGEIKGHVHIYHDVHPNHLRIELNWTDNVIAASRLIQGKTLTGVLNKLSTTQIDRLRKHLATRPLSQAG